MHHGTAHQVVVDGTASIEGVDDLLHGDIVTVLLL
jgi:hypothetical protein